jgi:hypothetical protein
MATPLHRFAKSTSINSSTNKTNKTMNATSQRTNAQPNPLAPSAQDAAIAVASKDQVQEFQTILQEIEGDWAEIKNLPVLREGLADENSQLKAAPPPPNVALSDWHGNCPSGPHGCHPVFGSIAMSAGFSHKWPSFSFAWLESHKLGGGVGLPRESKSIVASSQFSPDQGVVEFARAEDTWGLSPTLGRRGSR